MKVFPPFLRRIQNPVSPGPRVGRGSGWLSWRRRIQRKETIEIQRFLLQEMGLSSSPVVYLILYLLMELEKRGLGLQDNEVGREDGRRVDYSGILQTSDQILLEF